MSAILTLCLPVGLHLVGAALGFAAGVAAITLRAHSNPPRD
ncbi:MAG: hypothetical protein ACRDOE_11630 [Streptosporangiaceae bacterium]